LPVCPGVRFEHRGPCAASPLGARTSRQRAHEQALAPVRRS
jgi:hypothetical protein